MTRLFKYLGVTNPPPTPANTHIQAKHLGIAELARLVVCLPEVAGKLNNTLDVWSLQWSSYLFS